MIAAPLNDRECLGRLTDQIRAAVDRTDVRDLAARFATTKDVVLWIRALRQRDDVGDPADGPRVDCDVSQRARVAPPDPNCVERSILYLAIAERIDPRPVRQLVTIETPQGRHTLPVEEGEPVVLDPVIRRNEARAAVWHITNAPAPRALPEGEAHRLLRWVVSIADDLAAEHCGDAGREEVARAANVFERLLAGEPAREHRTEEVRRAIRFTIAAADEAADLWGAEGVTSVHLARTALVRLGLFPQAPCPAQERRNLRIRLPNERELLHGARVVQEVGTRIALAQLLGPAFAVQPLVAASPAPAAPPPPPVPVTPPPPAPPPPPAMQLVFPFPFPATPAQGAGRR